MVWGYGLSASKLISKMQASGAWRANVIAGHGSSYAAYSKARNRSSLCRREASQNNKWHCVVKGEPCRELGLGSG
jgi:hypothetical protein